MAHGSCSFEATRHRAGRVPAVTVGPRGECMTYVRELGSGTFATCCAFDVDASSAGGAGSLKTMVAVKICRTDEKAARLASRLALSEKRVNETIARAGGHPDVVTFLGSFRLVGQHGGCAASIDPAHHGSGEKVPLALVFEMAREGDVRDLIRERRRRLAPDEVEGVLLSTCRALTFLHSLGFVHCDVKPANLLVVSVAPLRVKVADMGLACKAGSAAGSMRGSPNFISPEAWAASLIKKGTLAEDRLAAPLEMLDDSHAPFLYRLGSANPTIQPPRDAFAVGVLAHWLESMGRAPWRDPMLPMQCSLLGLYSSRACHFLSGTAERVFTGCTATWPEQRMKLPEAIAALEATSAPRAAKISPPAAALENCDAALEGCALEDCSRVATMTAMSVIGDE